jgi:hypothetical protein
MKMSKCKKQELIDEVIETIKFNLENADETAIEEMLSFIPNENLIWFLPEEYWKKYQSLM